MKNTYKSMYQMNRYIVSFIDEIFSDFADAKGEMNEKSTKEFVDYGFYAKKFIEIRTRVDEIAYFLSQNFDQNIPKNKELYVTFSNAVANFGFWLNDEIDIAEKLNKKAKALGHYGLLEYRKDIKRAQNNADLAFKNISYLQSIFKPPVLSPYHLDLVNLAIYIGVFINEKFYDMPPYEIDYGEIKAMLDGIPDIIEEIDFAPKDIKIKNRILEIVGDFYEVVVYAENNEISPKYNSLKTDLHNMTEYFYSMGV